MAKLLKWAAPALLLALSGCASGWPWGGGPPGPAPYQRYQATLHDPYPRDDIGPEVVGVRPSEYKKPLPEPVYDKWLRDSWWAF